MRYSKHRAHIQQCGLGAWLRETFHMVGQVLTASLRREQTKETRGMSLSLSVETQRNGPKQHNKKKTGIVPCNMMLTSDVEAEKKHLPFSAVYEQNIHSK